MDEVLVGGEVTVYDACTLIFSSPRDDRTFQRFLNHRGGSKKYMSVWRKEEITLCWELLYAPGRVGMSESGAPSSWGVEAEPLEAVMERFDRWGGIPRYVLEKTALDHQLRLREAIIDADLSALACSVGEVSNNHQSLRILHIMTTSDFDKAHIEFASKYVADEVFNTQLARSQLQVELFISATKATPELASVRGVIFERFAHVFITSSKRRAFRARRLGGSGGRSEVEITWPEMASKEFATAESLAALLAEAGGRRGGPGPELYLKPSQSNFPAVDAIVPGRGMLQMTVSVRHGMRAGAAFQSFWDRVLKTGENVDEDDGGAKKARFALASSITAIYFVVPEDIYHEFGHQQVQKSTYLASLQQNVICVPTASSQTGSSLSNPSSTTSSQPRTATGMEIDS